MKKEWYKNKTFVITGAFGDIGTELCQKFATLKMRMYLLDLPSSKNESLIEKLKDLGAKHVEAIDCDVTNKVQIEKTFKIIGEKENYIDILHNNAGIGNKFTISDENSFEQYKKIMAVNVDGMWLVLQAANPYIGRPSPTKENPERREGQLIFTSSSAGKTGIPYLAAYSMSKHAVVAFADSLRMEYEMKDDNIQVITACPAPAATQFWDSSKALIGWSEDYKKKGFLYQYITAKDIAESIFNASLSCRKEFFVPKWWRLLEVFKVFSHDFIDKMLMKIEKK